MATMQKILCVVLLLGVSACGEPRFDAPMTLAGETVSAEALNHGYEQYMLNCYACHGEDGDGKGPAAPYLRPQPRDFRTGVFKFGGVRNPGMPHTKDLVDLVKRGITGTAMLAWDLPDEDLVAIVQYIKTFSSAATEGSAKLWSKRKSLGERIVAEKDPWKGKDAEAIAHGEVVYHINAQCRTCHPSYITQSTMWDMSQKVGWGYAELMYRPQLKESDAFKGVKILPIDFLYHPIKSIRADDSAEDQRDRLYRVIGAGIPGAAMPTWKGALSEEDLWSLVYYVQSVADIRDTKKGRELRASLENQEPFVAPDQEGQQQAQPEGQ